MWIRLNENEANKVIEALHSAGLINIANRIDIERHELARDDRKKLIAAARDEYATGSNDDIEVDNDAAISESDEHAFVMMWGYVTYDEAGIEVES